MGFVPYVDISSYPIFSIEPITIVKNFALGFIVADIRNKPSWGGYYSITSDYYKKDIESIRKRGGDIIVSFGGAQGRELAVACHNPGDLYEQYKSVIETYNVRKIDFDIEGNTLYNSHANMRRSYAIQILKNTYPDLYVSLTLPVTDIGLTMDGMKLVKTTPCDMVNIMAMNFGDGRDRMAQWAIKAANAVRAQTGLNIGITVMIGKNDIVGETFTLNDAKILKRFVDENKWVKRVSIWSLNRDNGDMSTLDKSSLIKQDKFAFTKTLL